MKNILLISGSLRKKSLNTALLRAFEKEIGETANVSWADIQLPLYNEELEADFPVEAEALRTLITQSDAIIVSTPEYNRAMSGAIKNAIDWASRPYGKNAWAGKRILITSASPGGIAGAMANYQVKQSLLHLGAQVLGKPEFLVGGAADTFTDSGELTDEPTKEHIATAVATLLKD